MKYIKEGKISFDSEFPIKEKTIGTSTYYGQITGKDVPSIGMKVSNNIEEGVFVNNNMTGFGRIVYEDQTWYIGQVSNSLKNGNGTLTYSNGTSVYRTTWINDKVDCKDAYEQLKDAPTLKPIKYSIKTTK